MLGGSCSACCGCTSVWPTLTVRSGDASVFLANQSRPWEQRVSSVRDFLAVSRPGEWRTGQEDYFSDDGLPGQIVVFMLGRRFVYSPPPGERYWELPEFSQEARLWCDENGENPAAIVRLRVEHDPQVIDGSSEEKYALAMSTQLRSHKVMSSLAAVPFAFSREPFWRVAYIYIELLDGNRTVLQSHLLAADYEGLGSMSLALHAHVTDGVLHCWAAAGPSETDVNTGFGAVFNVETWHIFNPVSVHVAHQQVAIAMTTSVAPVDAFATLTRQPTNPFVSPCLPETKDDLCTPDNRRLRPWAAERCTTKLKTGRIRGSACGKNLESLVLTFPDQVTNREQLTTFAFGQFLYAPRMINGTRELGRFAENGELLPDGQFWFSENLNLKLPPIVSGGFLFVPATTVTRIEISATVMAEPYGTQFDGTGVTWPNGVQQYCTNWPSRLRFDMAVLFEIDEAPSPARFRRYFTPALFFMPDESFLNGQQVQLTRNFASGDNLVIGQCTFDWVQGLQFPASFTNRTIYLATDPLGVPTAQLV